MDCNRDCKGCRALVDGKCIIVALGVHARSKFETRGRCKRFLVAINNDYNKPVLPIVKHSDLLTSLTIATSISRISFFNKTIYIPVNQPSNELFAIFFFFVNKKTCNNDFTYTRSLNKIKQNDSKILEIRVIIIDEII